MFNIDGTLTIGFSYPNMYMSEDYNSPQSVYWALKSFLALGLPATHPFWIAEEKPLPRTENDLAIAVKPPMHILCNTGNHHFLLSSGQFCPWPLKATEAKYGKFAYSSQFGFSVPTGPLIQQIAPDSTLALSKDDGDTWRVPWRVSDHLFGSAHLLKKGEVVESVPTLSSTWKPWRDADIEVHTVLIAPCIRWPDWYVRVHTVKNHGSRPVELQVVQGGFAIQGRGAERGEVLPGFTDISGLTTTSDRLFSEGTIQSRDGVLVCSDAGSSGICAITGPADADSITPEARAEILKPDANTNLIWQRTLIPTLSLGATVGSNGIVFASAIFALGRTSDREAQYAELDVGKLWNDVPIVAITGKASDDGDCIVIR